LVPVLALALVVLIGVARLYLGVHHPTDVLASLVFMAVWLQRCAAVLLRPAQVTGPAPT
jgi:membrane-associated phospholipid phosphatase